MDEWAPLLIETKQDTPVAEHFRKKDHKNGSSRPSGSSRGRYNKEFGEKWIAQLKEDDRFQVINRNEGADNLSL